MSIVLGESAPSYRLIGSLQLHVVSVSVGRIMETIFWDCFVFVELLLC